MSYEKLSYILCIGQTVILSMSKELHACFIGLQSKLLKIVNRYSSHRSGKMTRIRARSSTMNCRAKRKQPGIAYHWKLIRHSVM
jgi:hypothetical protein